MSRIFISHSSKDNFAAQAVYDWLAGEGWDDVFLDIDPERGIRPGERWARKLHEAAHRCQAVIFLISRNWLASEWCDREFNLAVKLNKRLFGVLIDDTGIGGVPEKYRGAWQLLDLLQGTDHEVFRTTLKDGSEDHVTFSAARLGELREGLRHAGLDPEFFEWPPPNDADRAPYRGLAPLEKEDAGIFFGREAPLVDALDRLRGLREAAPPRILAILGASGAGKSSFLRAGLLPRLERDDRAFRVLPIVRPQGAPISGETGLVTAIASVATGVSRATIAEEVRAGGEAFLARLAAIAPPDGPTLVLPIDQAEELFGADAGPEATPFLTLLRKLAEHPLLPLLVLLTIRTDRYMQWQNDPALNGLHHETLPLAPMPRGAYRTVIEAPVARYVAAGHELALDPRLTEALLAGLEQGQSPDALPLLAFTLEQLFTDYRGDGELTLADYRKFGGIEGAISAAVARALADARGDRTGSPPPPEQLALLKRGLIPWLAGIDPATNTARRKTALWTDIPAEAQPLMTRLIDARLLRSDRNDKGEQIVEPAHEALLRQWAVLDGWLKDDLAALSTLDGVKDAARAWIANTRDAGFVVHAGSRLAAAEGLNQRKDLADNLTGEEREYLNACRAMEEERRDRELREAQRLARTQRVGLLAASLLILVAVSLAAVAVWQTQIAQEQTYVAKHNEFKSLTALGQTALVDNDLVSAAKLALAGLPRRVGDPPQQEISLDLLGEFLQTPPSTVIDGQSVASPDGSRILSWSGGALSFWNLETGDKVESGAAYPSGAEFSPDSTRALIWFNESSDVSIFKPTSIQLWNPATGLPLGAPVPTGTTMPLGGSPSFAFSSDSRHLASWQGDIFTLWDSTTGATVEYQTPDAAKVMGATFSEDGEHVASWSILVEGEENCGLPENDSCRRTGILEIRHTGVQDVTVSIRHSDGFDGVRFDKSGDRVLTWSYDGIITLWDANTGARIVGMDQGSRLSNAEFVGQEASILGWSDNGGVRLWSASSGTPVGGLDLQEGRAAVSADRHRIVTWSWEAAQVWAAETGTMVGPSLDHRVLIAGASLDADGTRAATWSENGTIHLWDVATGAPLGEPLRHTAIVRGVLFLVGKDRLLSWSDDGTARVWDASSGYEIGGPQVHEGRVAGASQSADGNIVLTWDHGSTHFLDPETGRAISGPVRGDRPVLSRDGSHVVTRGHAGQVIVSELRAARPAGMVEDGAERLVVSADRRRLASWSSAGVVQVRDATTGEALGSQISVGGGIEGIRFDREGSTIVVWSGDGSAQLWRTTDARQLGSTMLHDGKIVDAVFDSTASHLLTWSDDGTIKLWDAQSGMAVGQPMRHESLSGVRFDTDRSRILSWSYGDQSLKTWDAASGQPIRDIGSIEFEGIEWSDDGGQFVTWDFSLVRLWDTATAAPVGSSLAHDSRVRAARFVDRGRKVLSWAYSSVSLSNVSDGLQLGNTWEEASPIDGVVLSSDGSRAVVMASDRFLQSALKDNFDNYIQEWDLSSGVIVGLPIMADDPDSFHDIQFVRDDRWFLASSYGAARLLDAESGQVIGLPFGRELQQLVANYDGSRAWTLDNEGKVRQWTIDWPNGNIVGIACALLPRVDGQVDVSDIEAKYGIKIAEPICTPEQVALPIDWATIERIPEVPVPE